MSIIKRRLSAAALVILSSSVGSYAATVNIQTDEGTAMKSEFGVADSTSVDGAEMAGMLITAMYDDGSSESLTWQATGDRIGGVTGSSIEMSYANGGDGFTMTTLKKLTSFMMEIAEGNTFFDILRISNDDLRNTTGTSRGFPFELNGGDDLVGDIDVTYSNGLVVAGQSRAADTFTKMTVDYSGLEGGGFFGTTVFRTDLDELRVAGDISPVPLPAGMPLMLAGLGVLGLYRRRKS